MHMFKRLWISSRGLEFNARCAEIFPEAVAAIVQQGHDVAGHGYLQDQLLTALEPAEEQATIRRSLDILERATGQRPTGWISPVTAFTSPDARRSPKVPSVSKFSAAGHR